MSAWVAAGLVLAIAAVPCWVVGVRRGALTSSAPDRFSAPLPPLGPLALYALGFGLAAGALACLREELGLVGGVALGVAVWAVCASALRLARPRRWGATSAARAAARGEILTMVSASITCCVLVVLGLSSKRSAPVLLVAAALAGAIAIASAVHLLQTRTTRRG